MDVSPAGGGIVEVNQTTPSSYPYISTFTKNASVSLKAIPTPGYYFANWSGGVSGTTNPTTITIDCNKTITANFAQIMHSLTIEVNGGGSTTPAAGNHSYQEGTVVSITATPDSGWQFDGWTGDVDEPDLTTAILTIDSNKTITANFTEIMHTLTIEVNGSGSTTPTAGNHSYQEGTVVIITATPDSGWQFDGWTGDVAEPDLTTTTLTIDSNKTITANFAKPNWWLIGGTIAGVIIVGVIIWFAVRRRTA